jgi:ribose transport system permease protein
MSAAAPAARRVGEERLSAALVRGLRRNSWVLGLCALLAVLFVITRYIQPNYGPSQVTALALAALPVALAAAGQAIAIISGGIDLSVGSMMALTSVTAAVLMKGNSEESAIIVVVGVLLMGLILGAINGSLVVLSRVPDIVVTLAMMYVWAGAALLVLNTPGGGTALWLKGLIDGSLISEWVPKALILLLIAVFAIWIQLKRSRLGLSLYAVGSHPLAAFRSGVSVGRTKVAAYALTGLFAAMGGLSLTMSTGIGTPVPGPYLLASVAAVVLGGVSLAGGRGGLVGPIVAVFILRLVRTDLTLLGIDPNYTTVIEGAIMVGVVMVGGLIAMRGHRS